MNPNSLLIPLNTPVLGPDGKMVPVWWKYFHDIAVGLTTIDLTSQVTGILPPPNGGSGIGNTAGKTITLGGTLTTSGAFNLTLTQTAATNVTLPTSGLLVATDSPLTAITLTVSTSVAPDSGAIKHKRVTTGSVAGGATALVTVTWGTAFADANYTVTASVVDSTAAVASMSVVHIEEVLAASVKVRVTNAAVGAVTGQINVIALHD